MTASLNPESLGELLLFQGLQPDQLARIHRILRRSTFAAGYDLMTAEQPGEIAYIILNGTVKIHVEQASGGNVILAILGPGEIVGEMSLLEQSSRSANVVTLEESTLLWLHREAFEESVKTIPLLTYNLVRLLSRRLRLANQQIQALANMDVFGRVARQLLAFAEEYGRPTAAGATLIPLRLTQSDLAGLVGASRVRVNQVLVFYRQSNYISINQDNRITILNREALLRRCQ